MSGASDRGQMTGGHGAPFRLAMGLLLGAAFLLAAAAPAPAAGQGTPDLATACAGAGGETVAAACADGALAALALQAGYGLLLGAGGPVPASPSTAGHRLPGSPRWVFDAGVGWASFRRPDLTDPGRTERRAVAAAPRLTVSAGIFDGFAPASTVGGVGALDLVGELRVLPLPVMEGLSGRAFAWGAGARVGIFRESFTLPGVTLSVMHRRSGALRYESDGDPGAAERVVARIDPAVTSVRAVVGKDLWEIGVSGGVQWDRVRGDARVDVDVDEQGRTSGAVGLPVDRETWFVALNRTWVVTQLSFELGWSPGPGGAGGVSGTGPFRAPGSAWAGALTFRLRY